jgi:erythromycin esterase-like protein
MVGSGFGPGLYKKQKAKYIYCLGNNILRSMRRIIIVIVFVLIFIPSYGQNYIKSFILNNAQLILSIDPENNDYSDLQAIGNALGNSRIVMLGEQDHGDAPTFLAKTRLIKYLVEKKGFNVIAFESDFYSLHAGWQEVSKKKDSIFFFLKQNIFDVWSRCDQLSPLFDFLALKGQENEINITGFDNQHVGQIFQKGYYNRFYQFLDTSRILSKKTLEREIFADRFSQYFILVRQQKKVPDSLWNYIISSLSDFNNKATMKYGRENFWAQELKSLQTEYEQGRFFASGNGNAGEIIRDKQMADNLSWLIQYAFPHQKIIVWAHNIHIARDGANAFSNKDRFNPMANYLFQASAINNTAYVIGFTSLKGIAGKIGEKQYRVDRPKSNSFETWMAAKNYRYAFLDFQKFKKEHLGFRRKFYMKAKTNHKNVEADWINVFDGVFYIETMYPCDNSGTNN